jgi:hypothetical protein
MADAILFPRPSILDLLTLDFGSENTRLHLYTNHVVTGYAAILSDFTEAAYSGYTSLVLNKDLWVFSLQTNIPNAIYPEVTFSPLLGGTFYGWYLTSLDNTKLKRYSPFTTSSPIIYDASSENRLNIVVSISHRDSSDI